MFFYIFETQKNRDLFEFNAMFFKTLNLPLKHTAMKRITIISFDLNNFQMLFFIQHHWVCGSNIDFISFFKRRKNMTKKIMFGFYFTPQSIWLRKKMMKFSITTHTWYWTKNMTKQYEKEIEHWAYHKRNTKNTRDVTYKKLYSCFLCSFTVASLWNNS